MASVTLKLSIGRGYVGSKGKIKQPRPLPTQCEMTDKYSNYKQLVAAQQEGRDYRIRCSDRKSDVLIFSPHAGEIEPGTSELVRSIAGADFSFYLFEGIKRQGNSVLHITSTRFDEPKALELLGKCSKAVALHGAGGEAEKVYVGGRDDKLRLHIEECLQEARFHMAEHHNPGLQGTSLSNVCNRCVSGAGLQLEISRGLRRRFFRSLDSLGRKHPTDDFRQFVDAIREGLNRAAISSNQ